MSEAIDREKLIKLLGMLSSNHYGEVVSFAKKACDLLRSAGLTWADIVTQPSSADIEDAIIFVDVRSGRLPGRDLEIFSEIREKFLSVAIDQSDRKRVLYLKRYIEERVNRESEDRMPF